jgi:hypothetical protein
MRDALVRVVFAAATASTAHTASAQPASAAAAALSAQQQGNAMAAALLREDYLSVAATACSPVLARVGGVQALARQIEVGFKVMQQQGRRLVDMRFGAVDALVEGAATRFALIPYRSVVLVRDGRLSLESFYLGVQNVDGDAWCFIDTAALNPAILHELFPGAPETLRLPAPAAPLLETPP